MGAHAAMNGVVDVTNAVTPENVETAGIRQFYLNLTVIRLQLSDI